jgi:hypothetical protein
MKTNFMKIFRSPDGDAGGVSAAGNSAEGSGGKSPSAAAETVPPGTKEASDANPASKKEKVEPKSKDTSSSPPQKSFGEKLKDIAAKRAETLKQEEIKKAREDGKKEAIAETQKKPAKAKSEKEEESLEAAPEGKEAPDGKEVPKKYEPNHKYKVKDQEHEFDDVFKKAIKDEAAEKKLRELYERSHGLDFSKARETELDTKYKSLEQKFQPVMERLKEANEAFQRNDLDTVFEVMAIPQEKVLQWLANKAQYEQMSPAEKQRVDQGRNAEVAARKAQQEAASVKDSQIQEQSKAKLREFELVTKIPEYKSYADSFDASRKAGAFREAVADIGELAFMRGKDLSVEEAIKELMSRYGSQSANPPKTTQSSGAQKAAAESGANGSKKETPVIPHVGGRSETPVEEPRKYRSIQDLKNRYKELSQSKSAL